MTRYAPSGEGAMQPEAVPSGFVATHDRRVGGEPEADFRRGDLRVELREIARRHCAQPRRIGDARRERQLPDPVAEIQREMLRRSGLR